MRFSIYFLVFVISQCCALPYTQPKKFFREYYSYFDSTESFYKINTRAKTWQGAKITCESEGASFFYPEDYDEAKMVATFMKTRLQSSRRAFIAASTRFAKEVFEIVDGELASNVYLNWALDEPSSERLQSCITFDSNGTMHDEDCISKHPFICKKTLSSLQWDTQCNMPDIGYQYNEDTGRCYKFHEGSKTWTDAYATCRAELSYLAVIDNQLEANVLVNLSVTELRKIEDCEKHDHDEVFMGFHNIFDEGWATIKGIPLLESGYANWNNGEPSDRDEDEKCGSMYYRVFPGRLNDVSCDSALYFICEHEIETKRDKLLRSNDNFETSTSY